MTGSFRKIDYRLRPAKHVERLMLCDTFRRLKFSTLEDYQYVGMGSVYFSDFSLFHRALGIRSMKCIEGVTSAGVQKRFHDNVPFSNIDILWGRSNAVLPQVDFEKDTIIWLDYDGRLDLGVLNDISSVVAKIKSGSFLTLSVQCLPDKGASDAEYDVQENTDSPFLSYAEYVFGKSRVDQKWHENDLLGWGTASLFWELMKNEIESTLSQRNAVDGAEQLCFEQVLHFHYADGANMLTVGWVFFSESSRFIYDQCSFQELTFYRAAGEPFKISLPLLTLKELRHLERQMPSAADNPSLGSIPPGDARKFMSLYRYFPNFAATDL
jgi:hypothetical protein